MNEAIKTMEELASCEIRILNALSISNEAGELDECITKRENVLQGIILCLKNVAAENTERFYSFCLSADGYEFGYFDDAGIWVRIEGVNSTH